MRKVIVVDWLDTYGGAERVIKSLYSIFSFDKCYTLINIMSKNNQNKIFSKHPAIIKETTLKHCGSKFRWFFILFHFLFSFLLYALRHHQCLRIRIPNQSPI